MARRTDRSLLLFSGGEITPLLAGRSDVERVPASCRTLQNMVVDVEGPVTRRAGLQYVGSIKGGSVAEQTIVVYGSISNSGVRGSDVWSLFAELTLYPFADPSSQRFRSPDLHIRGTFTGASVISTCQIEQAYGVFPWLINFRMESGTNPNDRYWLGDVFDESPPGFVDGPLFAVPFGIIGYVPPTPLQLTAGNYYRLRLAGQVDPSSEYGTIVTSNWFTLEGGFEADGFVPP